MSKAISFKEVSKEFPGGTHALRDINFEVNEGEFMVVVGPSGCGKSTILRLIAGLESQSSGQIDLFGKNAGDLSPQQRDLGMVFQNYALFPHLSVFDNIAYGLKIRRESGPEIRQKVDFVARKLDILELLQRKPHQLSGGQRQRVALGRLLARNPKIHLFDEPLGNLDPQFRSGLRTELYELHRDSSRTTVYVTHDQAEAMTLGQKVCVLRKGQVLQIGSPEEIYNHPTHRFVAEFFGSPGAQCIDGRIEKNGEDSSLFITTDLQFKLDLPTLPSGSITLGIRPEDWQISSPENSQIQAVIKRIENLGDHRLIEAQTGGGKIIIKTSSTEFYENEKIGLNLPKDKVHWFERYTGKRIQTC
jgi:ABC-type sugar transport system ATPase subunit